MQIANTAAARATEAVMLALRFAQVLKDDEPNYPTHYNRAFSAVLAALEQQPDITPSGVFIADGMVKFSQADSLKIEEALKLNGANACMKRIVHKSRDRAAGHPPKKDRNLKGKSR